MELQPQQHYSHPIFSPIIHPVQSSSNMSPNLCYSKAMPYPNLPTLHLPSHNLPSAALLICNPTPLIHIPTPATPNLFSYHLPNATPLIHIPTTAIPHFFSHHLSSTPPLIHIPIPATLYLLLSHHLPNATPLTHIPTSPSYAKATPSSLPPST